MRNNTPYMWASCHRLDRTGASWHHIYMRARIVRLASLGRVLGLRSRTVKPWAEKAGARLFTSPVRQRGTRGAPLYLTMDDALLVLHAVMPRLQDRADRERARHALAKEALAHAESVANLAGQAQDHLPGYPIGTHTSDSSATSHLQNTLDRNS